MIFQIDLWRSSIISESKWELSLNQNENYPWIKMRIIPILYHWITQKVEWHLQISCFRWINGTRNCLLNCHFFVFYVSEWTLSTRMFGTIYRTYLKFTMTGSPYGDKCKQTFDCLVMQEGYPLKVFTTIDLNGYWEGTPMDGVVRNLAFTNIATDITMNTNCWVSEYKCTLYHHI